MTVARRSLMDLTAAAGAVASRQRTAASWLDDCLAAAGRPACARVFLRRFDAVARAQAEAVDALVAAGGPAPPLAGLAVSIKDLFDVAGQPTTGGSLAMADAAPAASDAPAVQRLRDAGAALIGHTNLTEFAYSGVGINPHHGTPLNAGTLEVDDQARAPGGSSSGGASSVTAGAAFAALGSDTGGSIRIPAALQGLVGFKNTQRLTPLDGAIPLSTSLDTACAMTRTVRDAVLLHEVLAARRVQRRPRPATRWRVAVPTTVMLDGLEPHVAESFDRALRVLRQAGMAIDEIPLAALTEPPAINAKGGFTASESWHWHRERLATREAQYDPRVALRIRRGAAMDAADYIELLAARRAWIASVSDAVAGYDALLSPTVPLVAPPVAPLIADDGAFFEVNGLLLRNPSLVNFLDGCALSLPCHPPGTLPVGLMVWSTAMQDDTVLELSLAIETLLAGASR